jgi:YggT family protein
VSALISGFDVALVVLRYAFFAAAAVLAVMCTLDWAVRTRRISPFSGVARFFRTSFDPFLAPVERRVVRAGGVPTSAPWWALGVVVLLGIVVISLLGFVRNQIAVVGFAAASGPAGMVRVLIAWAFAIMRIAIIVRVIVSWVRVSEYSPWVRWAFVLTEPIMRPLRRIVPTIGMIDITPIVAYFLLYILESIVVSVF